jgi:DNA-binding response OmpR family regulator
MPEPRILIVENDDALRQKLYRAMLDVELFSDSAGDAREALSHLARQSYSVIVLDLGVAGGSEAVLAAVQRMAGGAQPIVLATAEGDSAARVETEGVQVVIRRPLRVREIAELARACTDASTRRRGKAAPREDELRA